MKKIFGSDTITKKLFFSYLRKTNIKSLKHLLDNQNYISFFKTITQDFLNEKLDTDDFSVLLEKLWIVLSKNKNTKDDKITFTCLLGAELEWYLRNDPVKAGEFLKQILDFYNKLG